MLESFATIMSIVSPLLLAVVVYLTARENNHNSSKAAEAAARVEVAVNTSAVEHTVKLDTISGNVDGRLTATIANVEAIKQMLTDVLHPPPTPPPIANPPEPTGTVVP